KFRKSATIVGETLGKYHPHGDAAVYESMVKMAQEFHSRYPLVKGQGNFGSMDNDPAAAPRYTEAKMTKIADEMLGDIDKETVDWVDNYDGTIKEPSVLPAKLPQLLLNGGMGIAVGMATNIPPHNLSELIDGIIYLIDNPKATVKELFQFIKGPDFPTGGEIYNKQGMIEAYSVGRGPIVCRAKAEIIEKKAGKFQIIITEMTYGVNKANLIIKIADLVRSKKLQGINTKEFRDESDKDGVRIVIGLKNDAQPQKVLNRLFKLTDLQKTFHLNMLALVDGIQPQVLSLRGVLEEYIKHRQTVVTRRTQFDLKQAKERAHILMGLNKALDCIDAVIKTIKSSADKETARKNLIKKFKFSVRQTEAILEMRLQALAGLERKKIKDELREKEKIIKALEALLKSPKKIMAVVKDELKELKEKYADKRRTKVFSRPVGQLTEEELIPEEKCVIILTKGGYIKRINPQTYKSQKRGGKGVVGITPREEDAVGHFIFASTHDNILFFTDQGRVFQTKAYEIPETSRVARGQAIVNILQLGAREKIATVFDVAESAQGQYLVMVTKNGIIKRTKIEDFKNVRRSGLLAIKLGKDDKLKWSELTSGKNEIILITAEGQSIRFKEGDIRAMGRTAAGVRGIRLKKGDKLVGMGIIGDKTEQKELKVLVITENGFGKKTDLKYYKAQKRGGTGIKTAKINEKTGNIAASHVLNPETEDLIVISKKGQVIRMQLKSIPLLGRATQGVKIMKLNKSDKVVTTVCL
ncbi:MAG: DNA gyrase subunit A, partial [Patescibacteria group bacterium]|nr:DNA gyrase subunit A [Patescibacteria group bacterium]